MNAFLSPVSRVFPSDGSEITPAMPVITAFTAAVTVLLAAWMGYGLSDYEGHCIVGAYLLAAAFAVRRVAGPSCRITVLLECFAYLYVFVAAVRLLIYLTQALAFPLCDEAFTLIDTQVLGLDFAAFMHWLDARPLIAVMLAKAYMSFFWQNPLTVVLLPLLGRGREAERFVVGFMLTMLIVTFFSTVMPSIGPLPTIFGQHFETLRFPGAQHIEHVNALRSGAMREISLVNTLGIISYPSFHAACALLCTWAWRSVRVVVVPLAVVNIAMAISAIPEGAHYAIDVVAGLGIAALVIGLARVIVPERGPRPAAALERAPAGALTVGSSI
jgi:hypothetical protein